MFHTPLPADASLEDCRALLFDVEMFEPLGAQEAEELSHIEWDFWEVDPDLLEQKACARYLCELLESCPPSTETSEEPSRKRFKASDSELDD